MEPFSCDTSLACVTVSVQSDLILPQLQQHLGQRWTALQQCIMDELIDTDSMFLFVHFDLGPHPAT